MTRDLIYLGIGGSVLALRAGDGVEVWRQRLGSGSGTITGVTLLEGRLLATLRGELTCLDPATGRILWVNKLKGLGTGYVAIAGAGADAGAGAEAELQAQAAQSAAVAASVAIIATSSN